jgi:twinkle protein
MTSFADHGIEIPEGARGPEVFLLCPKCSHTRRKKRVLCLLVNIEIGVWCCHHCEWSGGLKDGMRSARSEQRPKYRKPDALLERVLPQNAAAWFHSRAITDAVLSRNRIESRRVYMTQLEDFIEAVIFPYFRNGELVNLKYRAVPDKSFRLEPKCELVLFGLDDIEPAEPLIWVEGEMDKLALDVAGFRNVVSVPNGAPPPEAKNYAVLLKFLDADSAKIQSVQRHVLAGDSDIAGVHLEGELSRRLGIEKCCRVRWPAGVKDANEMLIKHGALDLAWYIENAEPFPFEGVFEISDRREDLLRLYEQGFERGHRTGWRELDKLYTVRPGEFTAVTGIPSSGKSNWLDCLLVNLANSTTGTSPYSHLRTYR